ncbi:MAG: hypothetical protein E6I48_05140 [Chloroflexi bacterium]|nr:MAG: hypothetical protein E6I48_05140 [Chloroflexota bacterium]
MSMTLASLLGPTSILAMLAVLVALGVIVGGLIAEHWVVATLRRMAASTRPAVSPPAEPAPEAPSARDAA